MSQQNNKFNENTNENDVNQEIGEVNSSKTSKKSENEENNIDNEIIYEKDTGVEDSNAVDQVESELKKERVFNNFNGWLSIVTFSLLILFILGDYIYESSNSSKNKTRMNDIRSNVIRLEDKLQSLSDSENVSSITLQNTVNHIQDVEEKLHELQKQFIVAKTNLEDFKKQKDLSNNTQQEIKLIKVGEDPEKLLRNEALYLIKLSYRKMYLEHDVQTSISLLKEADASLSDLSDPQVLQIRKSISTDIRHLSGLDLVDSESLIIRLSALEENIKNLPTLGYKLNFNSDANSSKSTDRSVSENIGDWKENFSNSLGNFLGNLVVIKKNNATVPKFLSKDEIAILHDKLIIAIMEAQMAVYAQQQMSYEVNLRKAYELVNEFFDKEDPSTEQVLSELKELQSHSVIFIGVQQFESLNLLRDYMKSFK